jgi:hypothetical protein
VKLSGILENKNNTSTDNANIYFKNNKVNSKESNEKSQALLADVCLNNKLLKDKNINKCERLNECRMSEKNGVCKFNDAVIIAENSRRKTVSSYCLNPETGLIKVEKQTHIIAQKNFETPNETVNKYSLCPTQNIKMPSAKLNKYFKYNPLKTFQVINSNKIDVYDKCRNIQDNKTIINKTSRITPCDRPTHGNVTYLDFSDSSSCEMRDLRHITSREQSNSSLYMTPHGFLNINKAIMLPSAGFKEKNDNITCLTFEKNINEINSVKCLDIIKNDASISDLNKSSVEHIEKIDSGVHISNIENKSVKYLDVINNGALTFELDNKSVKHME